MPGPGHWAKVAAGQKSDPPVLPARFPGQSERISFEPRFGPASRAPDSDPQPPQFEESVEFLVDTAMRRLGAVRAVRDLQEPHSGLARVLQKEAERREQHRKYPWPSYAPHYDDPGSQRQLRLFCALLRAFEKVGVKGRVSEESEWKQGAGTTYHLQGGVTIGDVHVGFRFLHGDKSGKSAPLTLKIGSMWSSPKSSAPSWSDAPGSPLEKQLTQICCGLLTYAEQSLREGAQHRYEWQLEQIARAERERQERLRAEEAQRQAALAQEVKRRREALFQLVARRERSLALRRLVSELKSAQEAAGTDPDFHAWCAFALAEADSIDPLLAPLQEIIGAGHRLSDQAGNEALQPRANRG
jgi:hypothetical protein